MNQARKILESLGGESRGGIRNDIIRWFNDNATGTRGMMGRTFPDANPDDLFKIMKEKHPDLERAEFDKALKSAKKTLRIK